MAAASSGQNPPENTSMTVLWVTASLFILGVLAWLVFHAEISTAVLWWKRWQVSLLTNIDSRYGALLAWMNHIAPMDMTPSQIQLLCEAVGKRLWWPFSLLLLAGAAFLYFGHNHRFFTRTMSMRDLVQSEKNTWPMIKPVYGLDLLKTPLDEGPWAMSLTPLQFARKHELLIEEVVENDSELLRTRSKKMRIELEKTHLTFVEQLGPLWKDATSLPPHMKALFGIFASRANRDRDSAVNLLNQICNSTENERLNFSGADELVKKYLKTHQVQQVIKKHAYRVTVLLGMLEIAREDGVVATSEFVWLKPVDRTLWYALNSLGRRAVFPEAAGILSHHIAETKVSQALSIPMVDPAVQALSIAMTEQLFRADEMDQATFEQQTSS